MILGDAMRGVRALIAIAFGVGLGAGPALAVDVTGTSAGFQWTAATGPVVGYAVQVSRNGGAYREEKRVSGTGARVSGQVGETIQVRVAAYNWRGDLGTPSTASDTVRFIQDVQPAPSPTQPPPGTGGDPSGDVDGDGMTDSLAFNQRTGQLSALLLHSDGTREWQPLGSPSDAKMRPMGYADVDGDGQADVLWRNPRSGANELWRMSGTSYSVVSLPDQPRSHEVAAFRDFSGDGLADVLFHEPSSGDSEVWTLTGAGRSAVLAIDPAPADMTLAAVADLDGDAAPDLVWQDSRSGALEAWRMNGTSPVAVFSLPDAPTTRSRVVGSGDFDGDGAEDLVWYARFGKKRREAHLWFMDGMNAPSAGVVMRVGKKVRMRGVVDMNNDGRADLVVVRRRGFTAYSVSPTGSADFSGAMKWDTQALDLAEIPASKRWYFLVLQ
jgi:hypothetical protein